MASAKTTVVRALVSAFLSAAFLVTPAFAATHLARDYAPLLKDWSRTAAARANRTITVRRAP